jgi:cytochrome c-type protein NapB
MNPETYRKSAWIFGAILVTASVSGYFMGLRQTGSQISLTRTISLATPDPERRAIMESNTIPLAVGYSQQDWLRDGPNAAWSNHLAKVAQPAWDPAALTNVTEAERAQAISERAARRAFDGAPPVVPHPIPQDSSFACLACHGRGLVIKDRIASKMSHPPHASCTQCHVLAGGLDLPVRAAALREPLAANEFMALTTPTRGIRAWPQAPPTVPHSTHMRDDCMSCHGPRGLFGLRTPHPDRQSCLQCHAPNAELDQHRFLSSLQPPPQEPSPNTHAPPPVSPRQVGDRRSGGSAAPGN